MPCSESALSLSNTSYAKDALTLLLIVCREQAVEDASLEAQAFGKREVQGYKRGECPHLASSTTDYIPALTASLPA